MQISIAMIALMGVANAGYWTENNACGTWHEDGGADTLISSEVMLVDEVSHDGDDAAKICTSYCNDFEEATCCMALRYYEGEMYIVECEAHSADSLTFAEELTDAYGDYLRVTGEMENEGGGFSDSATTTVFSAAAVVAGLSLLMN